MQPTAQAVGNRPTCRVRFGRIARASRHQASKLTQFSNSRLQFFGFIWYKQFTESSCVASRS